MNFDAACLDEYKRDINSQFYQKAYQVYDEYKAERELKNLLKYKYGKVLRNISPKQIFQLEGSGSKVLELKYKKSGAKIFAVIQRGTPFNTIKKQIKQLGFKIKKI